MRRASLLGLAITCAIGCSSWTKRFDQHHTGVWSAKALIQDQINDANFVVNLDIKAIDSNVLRIDIYSPFGDLKGAILVKKDSFQALLIDKRIYYHGKNSHKALETLINIPIPPTLLFNVMFERPIQEKGWNCTNDSDNLVERCVQEKANLSIHWSSRFSDKRSIFFEHKNAKVQLSVRSFTVELPEDEKWQVLKIPKVFESIPLR